MHLVIHDIACLYAAHYVDTDDHRPSVSVKEFVRKGNATNNSFGLKIGVGIGIEIGIGIGLQVEII